MWPEGASHSIPTMAAAISSLVGFFPPLAAIAFSTAVLRPSRPCTARYCGCTGLMPGCALAKATTNQSLIGLFSANWPLAARADDHAIRHLVAERLEHVVRSAQDDEAVLEEAARHGLKHEGLEIAAPEARIDEARLVLKQGRDLGAILPGAEFGPQLDRGLRLGIELRHAALEILPGILAPGVILIDGADIGHLEMAL